MQWLWGCMEGAGIRPAISDRRPARKDPLHRLRLREVEQPAEKGDKKLHGRILAPRTTGGKGFQGAKNAYFPIAPRTARITGAHR